MATLGAPGNAYAMPAGFAPSGTRVGRFASIALLFDCIASALAITTLPPTHPRALLLTQSTTRGVAAVFRVQMVNTKVPAPIDEKTLLSSWYVGPNTPESQSKVMLSDLRTSGAVGEFLVIRATPTDHVLLIKTAQGKATPFSIDSKVVGSLQGFTIRGSSRAFVTIHDLVR